MVKKSQYPDKIPSIHGSLIAAAREKREWTQGELAQRSGVARETIATRELSIKVRGDIAAQFDEAFGGPAWRTAEGEPKPGHDTAKMLKDLTALVGDLKDHISAIERKMTNRRKRK